MVISQTSARWWLTAHFLTVHIEANPVVLL